MKYDIRHRFSDKIVATLEIDCDESETEAVKLRLAIISAHKQGFSLRGADLRGADLRNLDLTGMNLYRCDLRGAKFAVTYLCDVDLRDATLTDADFSEVDLHGAKLDGVDMTGVKIKLKHYEGFRGFDLRGAIDIYAGDSILA